MAVKNYSVLFKVKKIIVKFLWLIYILFSLW